MHAIIISGDNTVSRAEFISSKATSQIELIHITAEKNSITIKQIQELNEPLSIAARLPRIIWIEGANLLTVPSQNALLKMLEEPPENTNFYLTCHSESTLLPTIRSRCQTIILTSHLSLLTSHLTDLKSIMQLAPGDRIMSIVKRDRAESIAWISQIELAIKDMLHSKNLTPSNVKILGKIAKSALKAHSELLANCSVSLVTQNFYLTLPHTRSLQ